MGHQNSARLRAIPRLGSAIALLLACSLKMAASGADHYWNFTRVPSSSLPTRLSDLFSNSDTETVLNIFKQTQSPEDCSKAKYLLATEVSLNAGWGWHFWATSNYMYHAATTGRILVYSSSLVHNMKWRWCEHPPYTYQCYFHSWSPCEAMFGRALGLKPQEGLPESKLVKFGSHTDDDQFVLLPNISDPQFMPLFSSVSKAIHSSSTPRGRMWWMGMAMKLMIRPLDWLEHAVDQFLIKHQMMNKHFVVVHIRRGHKFTEEKPVPTATYMEGVERLCKCFKTDIVFAMTEDNSTVGELEAWGKEHNRRVVYTDNDRHNADVWNVKLSSKYKLPPPDMDQEGWIAILNLFISRRGSALVGAFGSSYTKIVGGAMYAFHDRPVPILSVQEGWETHDQYKTWEKTFYAPVKVDPLPWDCLHPEPVPAGGKSNR